MLETGYFSENGTTYTITEMYPPRPWQNFFWNEGFLCSIDQFGFGSSWHRSEDGVRSDLTSGPDNRLIFIRDRETGKFWAANRNYQGASFDEFQTEVGLGYSLIQSRYHNIRVSFKLFVPTAGAMECWRVEVENAGNEPKNISLFAYANSDLNKRSHGAYNCGFASEELNGIFLSHHGFNLDTDLTHMFFAADSEFRGYETTNRRFRGLYGSMGEPDAVKAGKLASEGTSFDHEMIAALQFDLKLAVGEKRVILFQLGLVTGLEEAIHIRREKLSHEFFQSELKKIQAEMESLINKVYAQTPDEDINVFANVWLKRQINLGKTWGRTYAKGFRDIMQDTTAFVSFDPVTAREKIKYCLQHQFMDGNTLRQWQPIDEHPYRDGPSWIVPAVVGYLKETGNFDFLQEEADYYQGKDRGSVLDHCCRGMDFLFNGLGEHGLCLWGGGDWNDSLNNAGLQGRGESVWLTEAAVVSAREFALLLERMGEKTKAAEVSKHADQLRENLRKHAWDKDHFICGFTDWGEKIGSYESKEGKIFLNMQSWAVLAGVAQDGHALLDLVKRELSCPYGFVLAKPSYTKGDDHIGRVSYFEKGCYENGSVYNHGVAFKIAADCKLGRGRQAYDTLKKILPTNPDNPASRSGVEPYAVTNMYLSPENKLRAGSSLMGWITGTASWLYRCITEFMIGAQADYDGLALRPCLPPNWRDVSLRRYYRNAVYNIRILNPNGLDAGQLRITVDGNKIDSNLLPLFEDGQRHEVRVEVR